MGVSFLLDTNVLSELLKPRVDPGVVRRFSRDGNDCAIASVVWHELLCGALRAPSVGRGEMLARACRDIVIGSGMQILPYDETAATWHARERARLLGLARPQPYPDSQIAAIAATRNLTLITRNTRDFECFDGLRLENWFEAGKD